MSEKDLPTVTVHQDEIKTEKYVGGKIDFYNSEKLPEDPGQRKKIKKKFLKNVLLISVVFLFTFTAYGGLSSLQSSLHKDEGMGVITQSVVYGTMVLSCLFIPKLMISSVGHKWTIPISIIGYVLWMAANGYAVWGTMVTTSILVGFCAAPLWTAQCTYFTKIATPYAEITGEKEDAVVTRFFGIFFCIFQLSGLVGNVISSTVLRPPKRSSNNDSVSEEILQQFCGMNDCPGNNFTNENLAEPDSKTLWTLVGIYLGIACVGIIIACVFVDNLPKYLQDDKEKAKQETTQSALNTILHLKKRSQCLLIPITIYSGLEQGFFGAEWNRSFVSCSLGLWMVGFVNIPSAVVNALSSFTGGIIAKYTGRIPIFTFGLCLHIALQLSLILWPLDPSSRYVYFIIAACWGLADAIWQTQINALYGCIFADNAEAAFANYRMFESLGFILAFAWSNFLCTSIKLYVTMAMLIIGIICYYIVEYLERKPKSTLQDDASSIGSMVLDVKPNLGTIKSDMFSEPQKVKCYDPLISTHL